jgi:hypothetical protein
MRGFSLVPHSGGATLKGCTPSVLGFYHLRLICHLGFVILGVYAKMLLLGCESWLEEHEGSRNDSFCRKGCFSGVEQVFSTRKATTSGRFSKIHAIRFVSLPFVLTTGGGQGTDAVKPERIRFVKMTGFSEVQ